MQIHLLNYFDNESSNSFSYLGHFLSQSSKKQKVHPEKKVPMFCEMELFCHKITY